MAKRRRFTAAAVFLLLAGCGDESAPAKGSGGSAAGASPAVAPAPAAADARTFLQGLFDPAKRTALSAGLKPQRKDYDAVFTADVAERVATKYEALWGSAPVFAPNEGQTELLVRKATTEELQAWTGDANEFPGGYKKAAPKLKPGLVFHAFKFVKPGETTGMAYDGLVLVDGRWRIFPKPWRVLEEK